MSLRIKENIRILTLHGSEEEMAYQHGKLLKDEIPYGAIPYLANKMEYELSSDGPLKDKPMLRSLVLAYLKYAVFRPMIKHFPPKYLKIFH